LSMNAEVYRKEFIFDIDTKNGNKYYGDYRKVYPIIQKCMIKNGFERIEGSAYRSLEPMRRDRFIRIFRRLLLDNPDLSECIKDVHLSEVMDDYSLNRYVSQFKKKADKS